MNPISEQRRLAEERAEKERDLFYDHCKHLSTIAAALAVVVAAISGSSISQVSLVGILLLMASLVFSLGGSALGATGISKYQEKWAWFETVVYIASSFALMGGIVVSMLGAVFA